MDSGIDDLNTLTIVKGKRKLSQKPSAMLSHAQRSINLKTKHLRYSMPVKSLVQNCRQVLIASIKYLLRNAWSVSQTDSRAFLQYQLVFFTTIQHYYSDDIRSPIQ